MATRRKTHPPEVKAAVALEAVRGDRTVTQLADRYGVHPTLVHAWKRRLLAAAGELFAPTPRAAPPDARVTRLEAELAWVAGKLRAAVDHPRSLVDPDHPEVSVRRQCQLLGLSRSTLYYRPVTDRPRDLQLMEMIDRRYTADPRAGSRALTEWLARQGHPVNRKRVRRLMGLMGLEAFGRGGRAAGAEPGCVVPYLLADTPVERPDQVWSADVTYVPLAGGYVYLAATIDWFSRYVLAWRVSDELSGPFCREMLDEALGRGKPAVVNTDRGVPFATAGWVNRLKSAGVKASMDGRGRAADAAFVDRLWRAVKTEDIYPGCYTSVAALERGLAAYFQFFNTERAEPALDSRTPAEVYRGRGAGTPVTK